MRDRRLVFWLGALVLATAVFAYYYLTSNAGLERPLLHGPEQEAPAAPPAPAPAPAGPSAATPADDPSAIQKAGCRQSLEDLVLYKNGNVSSEIRPRDILSAEVRYCVEAGILSQEEAAGLTD
ncbi:hypothetical protein GCM10011491_16160 [Brucella endophytica]|uniref:Uncharacterized protein n=1 Tax=Brucella endophytica TaxID=1963359 RepID=A0A916SAT2_9HYPH|nr:hypothetical protein [Brucella endophytica]GGA89108.1 hypothetical protein GCM10011491_16160 [Brucella endophytica]